MPVSPGYREFALEQLGRVVPVSGRSMFGGVGVYSEGLFFALMADDTLYLKVDGSNQPQFEAAGMGPFRPYGTNSPAMRYYEVPAHLLEEPDALAPWVHGALEAARRKGRTRRHVADG
jgi:DNA transformation protein and related proteins